MTAEVIIMNKNAVAIAADSASTLNVNGKDKISNDANKLFKASLNQPIAAVIYNSSQINNIPWELIIKSFKNDRKDINFNTVKECADSLIKFIEESTINDESSEDAFIKNEIFVAIENIHQNHNRIIQEEINKDPNISYSDLQQKISDFLIFLKDNTEALDNFNSIDHETILQISEKYTPIIHQLLVSKNYNPQHLPIIHGIVLQSIFKKKPYSNYTGVALTGFGLNEFYPSTVSLSFFGIINNKVLFELNYIKTINHNCDVEILPLAQRDVVDTFILGYNPDFNNLINNNLNNFIANALVEIKNVDIINSSTSKDLIIHLFLESLEKMKTAYNDSLIFCQNQSCHDILSATRQLSIPELGQMAKSLVEITSFRRKISLGTETVGGPIDVAVISKGDGLIWISRKHYFNKEQNYHFFK